MVLSKKIILEKLKKDLEHAGYTTHFFKKYGLPNLYIGKGTLGPEMSWVSYLLSRYLLDHPKIYKEKKVLDMGTGSGVQAVIMASHGAKKVLGADISSLAVKSLDKNIYWA